MNQGFIVSVFSLFISYQALAVEVAPTQDQKNPAAKETVTKEAPVAETPSHDAPAVAKDVAPNEPSKEETSVVPYRSRLPIDENSLRSQYEAHKWRMSIGATNYDYREPGLMSLKGTLFATSVGYRWPITHRAPIEVSSTAAVPTAERVRSPYWIGVSGDFRLGRTNYDGSTFSFKNNVVTPYQGKSSDAMLSVEGVFGMAVLDSATRFLDLYAGTGLWVLRNKIDGDSSYSRTITYLYLPLGAEFHQRIGTMFSRPLMVSVGAQYNVFVAGSVTSYWSDLDSANSDIHNRQSSGRGFKGKVNLELNFKGLDGFVEWAYQTWDIAQSDTAMVSTPYGIKGLIEPHNLTMMNTVSVGARF